MRSGAMELNASAEEAVSYLSELCLLLWTHPERPDVSDSTTRTKALL